MNQVEQAEALEAARRAGIDLDLLDSNLALSYEERWFRHDEALEKVRAYEKAMGFELPECAIVRQTKLGIELRFQMKSGQTIESCI